MDNLPSFLDSVFGGAWPFLVGGVICLVDSDNERDLRLDFKTIYLNTMLKDQ